MDMNGITPGHADAARSRKSLESEVPKGIMGYDHICVTSRTWAVRPHTPLPETLLDKPEGICFQEARLRACGVFIVKPDIFNDAAAAGAEVFMLGQDHRTGSAD